jgi:hypothetical protein
MRTDLVQKAARAFGESATAPAVTLRAGNAIDGYAAAPLFEEALDAPTDTYLESNYWGLAHLDPASWRHYVPRLIEYALKHKSNPSTMVVDAFLASLRPPDREPPRFADLSSEQEGVLVKFLDCLSFDEDSAWSSEAILALEEYWAPGALYRSRGRET